MSGLILIAVTLFLILAFFAATRVHAQGPLQSQISSLSSKVDVLDSKHTDLAARVVTLENLPQRTAVIELKVDEILSWAKWIVFALAGIVIERVGSVLGVNFRRVDKPTT